MKVSLSALSVVALLALAPAAQAGDFYATPLNAGVPANLPGETLVPGLHEALGVVNGVTQPILQPILVPDAATVAPAGAAAPSPLRRHHRGHKKAAGHPPRHAHRTA